MCNRDRWRDAVLPDQVAWGLLNRLRDDWLVTTRGAGQDPGVGRGPEVRRASRSFRSLGERGAAAVRIGFEGGFLGLRPGGDAVFPLSPAPSGGQGTERRSIWAPRRLPR